MCITCRRQRALPFETPLHWTTIQIGGLSTDFRYMTCRVRGTHGPRSAVPSRRPAALHWPHALRTSSPRTVPAAVPLVPAVPSLPGDRPNGISYAPQARGPTDARACLRGAPGSSPQLPCTRSRPGFLGGSGDRRRRTVARGRCVRTAVGRVRRAFRPGTAAGPARTDHPAAGADRIVPATAESANDRGATAAAKKTGIAAIFVNNKNGTARAHRETDGSY